MSAETPSRPRIALVLQPLPAQEGEPSLDVRLRRLLKFALRACRLRCLEVRDLPAQERKEEEPP